MADKNEPTRRHFLKSITSGGAIAGVVLTDRSGILNEELSPARARPEQQARSTKGFGNATLQNGNLLLGLRVDESGLTLTHIKNQKTGFEHVATPSALFELQDTSPAAMQTERRRFAPAFLKELMGIAMPPPSSPTLYENEDNRCCSEICHSNKNIVIDKVTLSDNHSEMNFSGHSHNVPLSFDLRLVASEADSVILVQMKVFNTGSSKLPIRVVLPAINGLNTNGRQGPLMGAISQEIGTVVPITNTALPIGGRPNQCIGLPTEMNSMEVVSLYDPSGCGGFFLADAEGDLENGVAPIEFTLSGERVSGYWLTDLEPGETATVPALAMGVHDQGDWHQAVDYYVRQHRPQWHFAKIPAWFRDLGSIYTHVGDTAGAIYLSFGKKSTKALIGSFENLPVLLHEAQSLGTDVIYLWDYWEGAHGNAGKGDYIPRRDMGGEAAFREGIRRVHAQGGRVICYIESFIINYCSKIGVRKGAQWAGRDAIGKLYEHYAHNYSMVAPFRGWQDYVASTAVRLVRDYGVDGIFLDSCGFQMNWPMQDDEERKLYSPKQYSEGVLALVDHVRAAMQAVKPDAVVIGESTAGPVGRHWDGGLSADFAWLKGINQGRIIASPVRYGVPEVNFITNGHNLNELQQVFAAGHSLALSDEDLPSAAYVKRLVKIRQQYKDALIYGQQSYQPDTANPEVAAYFYRGNEHRLITAVNVSTERAYAGKLKLQSTESNSRWRDLLSGEALTAKGESLAINIAPAKLRVLIQEK